MGFQGFQACTPRVVPLDLGIKGYIEAVLGNPRRGTALGVQPWNP